MLAMTQKATSHEHVKLPCYKKGGKKLIDCQIITAMKGLGTGNDKEELNVIKLITYHIHYSLAGEELKNTITGNDKEWMTRGKVNC